MAAQHEQFLFPEHDMAVVRRLGREEGEEPSVQPLFVLSLRVASRKILCTNWVSHCWRSILHQGPYRRRQNGVDRALIRPCHGINPREVGIVRRVGVIGIVEAKEPPCRTRAGRQRGRGGLDSGAGNFTLEPFARQANAESEADRIAVAKERPKELHPVGRKAARAIQAAMDGPRMASILRQVLPAHDDGSATRVAGNMVVDVLRGEGLIIHHKAAVAEAKVLDENRIHGLSRGANIRHFQDATSKQRRADAATALHDGGGRPSRLPTQTRRWRPGSDP